MHPDDRTLSVEAWNQASKVGHYYCEYRLRRANSEEYRWHQTRAVPVGDASEMMTEWVGTSTDIHELKSLQASQEVLVAELQHRTRNLLAVVQSIARKTIRSSDSVRDFSDEFESRLRALGRVQGLFARVDHGPISLRELLETELSAHGTAPAESDKVSVEGPPVILPASSVQAVALALHELATNALKYGALSQPEGRLQVKWRVVENPEAQAIIDWSESGVQMPQEKPARMGYGRELIERALPYELKAKTQFEFKNDGVHCELMINIEHNEYV